MGFVLLAEMLALLSIKTPLANEDLICFACCVLVDLMVIRILTGK